MKKVKKKIFEFIKSLWPVQWFFAGFFWLLIKTIYWTNKKEYRGAENFRNFGNKAAIFVFWHGRSMMLSSVIRKFGIKGYAITSRHVDGRIMAKLQRMFGLKSIFGSTNVKKGGVGVLRQGVQKLRENRALILSPDGPRGPRMRLHDGCIYFAKMSGAPIIPVCFSASKPWFQKTWDRYLVVKMFGKVVCEAGEPFYYDRKNPNGMEDLHKRLEDYMVAQLQRLDNEFGHPIIPQANERKEI